MKLKINFIFAHATDNESEIGECIARKKNQLAAFSFESSLINKKIIDGCEGESVNYF